MPTGRRGRKETNENANKVLKGREKLNTLPWFPPTDVVSASTLFSSRPPPNSIFILFFFILPYFVCVHIFVFPFSMVKCFPFFYTPSFILAEEEQRIGRIKKEKKWHPDVSCTLNLVKKKTKRQRKNSQQAAKKWIMAAKLTRCRRSDWPGVCVWGEGQHSPSCFSDRIMQAPHTALIIYTVNMNIIFLNIYFCSNIVLLFFLLVLM